ncbi:hypothetical protein D3C74_318400 [compost metagenome]
MIKSDFASISSGYYDKHFKNEHLCVCAYCTGEEEGGVHDQPHQSGKGSKRTKYKTQTYKEFTVRNNEIKDTYVRKSDMFQKCTPPGLYSGAFACTFRNSSA